MPAGVSFHPEIHYKHKTNTFVIVNKPNRSVTVEFKAGKNMCIFIYVNIQTYLWNLYNSACASLASPVC